MTLVHDALIARMRARSSKRQAIVHIDAIVREMEALERNCPEEAGRLRAGFLAQEARRLSNTLADEANDPTLDAEYRDAFLKAFLADMPDRRSA